MVFNKIWSFGSLKIKSEYKRFLRFCFPQKWIYVRLTCFSFLNSAFFFFITSTAYKEVMQLQKPSQQETVLNRYITSTIKWLSIFAFFGVLTYYRRQNFCHIHRLIITDLSNRLCIRLRRAIFSQIISDSFFRKVSIPQTYVHHIISDTKAISEFLSFGIMRGVSGIFLSVSCSSYLILTSPGFCCVVTLMFTATGLFLRKRNANLRRLKEAQNLNLIELSQLTAQKLNNLAFIKFSNTDQYQKNKFDAFLNRFYKNSKAVARQSSSNFAYVEAFGFTSLFMFGMGGSLITVLGLASSSLFISTVFGFVAGLGVKTLFQTNVDLIKISGIYDNIEKNLGQIEYKEQYFIQTENVYDDTINTTDNFSTKFETKTIKQQNINFQQKCQSFLKGGQIFFQNISVGYYSKQNIYRPLLTNFSRKISAGSIVAIIGPSGIGKSTLFNVICKLVSPIEGNIFIDDIPLQKLTFKDIQQNISYVTQNPFIFKDTVRNNLIYGNQGFDCSDQHLIECLELANAKELIFNKKQNGLEFMIDQKGNNFSGGEKQRIALARALVKNPRILLLDEFTSGIDQTNEKEIIKKLKIIRKNMTTIIITHKVQHFKNILTQIIELNKH